MNEAIVARARQCLGARFRAQGRHPVTGLDCVGLAAFACGRGAPADYALRGEQSARIAAVLDKAGLWPIDPAIWGAGDVLVLAVAPGQLHLAIGTDRGFVHADAGLRRVVETPGRPPWPVIGAWRMSAICEEE